MNTLLLLLLDSRAPAGAHHHSGGMAAAVGTGLVTALADLEDFCRARLRTSARVSAAFAAAACRLQSLDAERAVVHAQAPPRAAPAESWATLDAEFDARTPSEAMRAASRQLGRPGLAGHVPVNQEPVTAHAGKTGTAARQQAAAEQELTSAHTQRNTTPG